MSDALKSRRLLALGVLVSVFAAGAVAGAAAARYFSRPTVMKRVQVRVAAPGSDAYRELDLSADQRHAIDSILERIRPRTDSLLANALPELRLIADSADAAIRRVLSPEQRQQLDSLQQARAR